MRFKDKVVLITGAARGIGLATAALFADEGAQVVAVDLSIEEGVLRHPATGAALAATCIAADCLSEAEVQAAVARTVALHGRIDVLVNGVGGSTIVANQGAHLDEMSLEDFERLVRFNLTPIFLMCKHVAQIMKKQKSGKIVNIGSISARGEALSSGAYGAAKAGVISLTRKLSRELAAYSINCNAISPGLTLTERIEKANARIAPDVQARRLASVPLGRFAQPIDQARVIAFLASSDADYVTGVTIDVTGGA